MVFILVRMHIPEILYFVISICSGMIALLCLLLWASPNVFTELESNSWNYVTSRPRGRVVMIIGKYVAAVLWACVISIASMTMSVAISTLYGHTENLIYDWMSFSVLLVLTCISYGAVYSLIGVIFFRRSMVIAVVYTMIVEVFLAFVPAVISKLTIRFHLQGLSIAWFGWIIPGDEDSFEIYQQNWGVQPVWAHLLAVGLFTVIPLLLAAYIIRRREYLSVVEVG